MKKLIICLAIILISGTNIIAQNNFITTWNMALDAGSGPNQISFSVGTTDTVKYTWMASGGLTGNGTFTAPTATITGLPASEIITLNIEPTNFQNFSFYTGDRKRLTNVNQWGTTLWNSFNAAFRGCFNLNITAADVPNLTSVSDMSNMFSNCSNLTGPSNINSWNTASVTDMQFMFLHASSFNQPIGSWNTANVTTMESMFDYATSFNQPLKNWNTAAVTYMIYMFYRATSFNQNIGTWHLNPNVDLLSMLSYSGMDCANYSATLQGWAANPLTPNNKYLGAIGRTYGTNALAARTYMDVTKNWTFAGDQAGAVACNLPTDYFITTWNMATAGTGNNQLVFDVGTTNTVKYTWSASPSNTVGTGTFAGTLATISGLPAGEVITLSIAPTNFESFILVNSADKVRLSNVNQWGTTLWNRFDRSFEGCSNLNITATDVPNLNNVSNMFSMFRGCSSLNSPANINTWNTSTISEMSFIFSGATVFNQNISNWNTALVTDMSQMFMSASAFNQNIGSWVTKNVTNMSLMFNNAGAFNQDISSWNTANVTNMYAMFAAAKDFNQPIATLDSNWNTSNVTNMAFMFTGALAFNQNIGNWNTQNVTTMNNMFYKASMFNQDISAWNTSNVTDMGGMFTNATAFNQNIRSWITTNVTDFSLMFYGATAFNQPIGTIGGSWNMQNATNMTSMFFGATAFNQNISAWNIINVTNMSAMFWGATAFNQNIGNWNTYSTTNMVGMFKNAPSFNQDISNWNTSNVKYFNRMFENATAFNQNLGSWNLDSATQLYDMLSNCGLNCANYSATLQGWAAKSTTPNNIYLDAQGLTYGQNALAAIDTLTTNKGWTIAGDNLTNITTVPSTTINPTCINNNGSIAFITTNIPDSIYTLNYTINGIATSASITVDSNAFVLDSLSEGVYSNFSVNYLCSINDTTPITLSLPVNTSIATTATNILYVKKGATGDGSSWANALGEAADALYIAHNNVANTINQIWVAAGTYVPKYDVDFNYCTASTNNRTQTFLLKNGVALYGGFVGNETLVTQANPNVNITLLSGDLGSVNDSTDNAYHVVIANNISSPTVLEGVTVSYGNTDADPNGVLFGYIDQNNKGGGIYLLNVDTNVTINKCVFSNNSAFTDGGGLYSISSKLRISNSKFINNSALFGGGIFIANRGNILNNVIVVNNKADVGGGIWINDSCAINNALFSNNNATLGGGGIFVKDNSSNIKNATITNNTAGNNVNNGAGVYNANKRNDESASFLNCIIWGNDVFTDSLLTPVYTNCNLQGIAAAGTNISANPNFKNSTNAIGADGVWLTADDGLQLACGSPCYNTGNNASAPVLDIAGNTLYGSNKDIGAYESQTNITAISPTFATLPAICAGNSFALPATSTNNITGTWLPAINSTSTTTYTFTPTAGQCVASTPSTLIVTVNPLPNVAITTTDSVLCLGQTANLTATGATHYAWNTNDSTVIITITPSINTSYNVTGIDSNGCANVANITQLVSTCNGLGNTGTAPSKMNIYPNPSNGTFNIQLNTNAKVIITNALGQVFMNDDLKTGNYNTVLSNVVNGVYFVKVFTVNLQETQLLIINK
jgi:surface protein